MRETKTKAWLARCRTMLFIFTRESLMFVFRDCTPSSAGILLCEQETLLLTGTSVGCVPHDTGTSVICVSLAQTVKAKDVCLPTELAVLESIS